jgi:predicted dehydrogenase
VQCLPLTTSLPLTMNKLKIGIVGIGHLGALHLKVLDELKDQADIVGICDINKSRTQRLATHYKVDFNKDYKSLIGKAEAVIVSVPTKEHHKLGKFFLENKVHTFIEKPITITVAEADDLITIAEKNKMTLQVGHVERFNSAFESIKHFTRNPVFIECHRLNQFTKRSLDIGVVMDLMIHDIDIILGIISSPLESISAVGINVLTQLDDIASVRLTFENGCVCNLTASRVSEDVMRKIRIFQKDTYISLDYVKQEAYIYKKHLFKISKHSLPIEKEQPLKKELSHFIDCVRNKKRPLVSGIEGREALRMALAITDKIKISKEKVLKNLK